MDYFEVVNSRLLYVLVGFVILYVFLLAFFFAQKAWKRAVELGFTKSQLLKVIKSTIVATIVPSFAIVLGLFVLATLLGNAWPWLRLSVIGSVTYESMAANMARGDLLNDVALSEAGIDSFVTIMFVMTAGISSGMLVLLFFGEKIQKGVGKLSSGKNSFGIVALESFMIALVATFLPGFLASGLIAVLTFLTSIIITVSFGLLVTKKPKFGWIKDFILAFALLGGMASSILWTSLLG